jgi:hypothetical protein
MGVYLITLFRGCTATGDIAGSCLQGCVRCGSAALPASAGKLQRNNARKMKRGPSAERISASLSARPGSFADQPRELEAYFSLRILLQFQVRPFGISKVRRLIIGHARSGCHQHCDRCDGAVSMAATDPVSRWPQREAAARKYFSGSRASSRPISPRSQNRGGRSQPCRRVSLSPILHSLC